MWRIELRRGKTYRRLPGQYYHRLMSPNGKVVYVSEMYSSKQAALKTIRSLIKTCFLCCNFEDCCSGG